MIISDPIQMRIHAFGDAAFSLLQEQYESKTPINIGEKEFIPTNLTRNFNGQVTTECGSNIQEFFRVHTPWSGEGLPPVGTVCEWRDDDSGPWVRVEVRYLSEFTVLLLFQNGPGDCEGAYSPADCQFRPIRTPEQIAADEQEKGILQMAHDCGHWWQSETDTKCLPPIFSAMWKAGYRKFEIVDN